MRFLIHLLILVLAAVGALYLAYGEVDPCRALAVEQARRSVLPGTIAEPLTGIGTTGKSEGECVIDLFQSWGDRVKAWLP